MGSNEAQRLLLSETTTREHSHINEKSDLQRRRPRRGGGTSDTEINLLEEQNNGVLQTPLHPKHIDEKQEAEFHFKTVFLCLAAYLGTGTLCFFLTSYQIQGIKTNGFLDALYFCVVTMTTVGYGDLVPNSTIAKLLACVYVFTGMALGGLILTKAADYIVEKQEVFLVKAMYKADKFGLEEVSNELSTKKSRYKFVLAASTFCLLMIVGTVFLYFVENLDFVDALYCVCSTVTTLGYGDKSFSTKAGRIFAVFWILSSTICLAQCFAYLAELYTEDRQRSLTKMVLMRKFSPLDLEAADLDGDKAVSAAEFVLYKLKEMGKINQEDISVVMEIFRKLDCDQSGTLTEIDIRNSEF